MWGIREIPMWWYCTYRTVFHNVYKPRLHHKSSPGMIFQYFTLFYKTYLEVFHVNVFDGIWQCFAWYLSIIDAKYVGLCFVIYLIGFNDVWHDVYPWISQNILCFVLWIYFGYFHHVFQFIFRKISVWTNWQAFRAQIGAFRPRSAFGPRRPNLYAARPRNRFRRRAFTPGQQDQSLCIADISAMAHHFLERIRVSRQPSHPWKVYRAEFAAEISLTHENE